MIRAAGLRWLEPDLHLIRARPAAKLKFSESRTHLSQRLSHPYIKVVGSAGQAPPEDLGERVSPVGNTARQWVDLRHDVTVSDIELSVRENFTAVEHIKRYTTLGMSVDQGKLGQAPAVEIIARCRGVAAFRARTYDVSAAFRACNPGHNGWAKRSASCPLRADSVVRHSTPFRRAPAR